MTRVTAYKVAQLRELASLGIFRSDAARLVGLETSHAYHVAKRYGIEFPNRPPFSSRKFRAVRAGYAANRPPSEIAAELGTTTKSVMVMACQMGITRGRTDTGRYRRPYVVPPDLMPRYKELRSTLRLTIEECGYELGLLERPKVAA